MIAYLLRNMERSGDAAIKLVERLDRVSLETKSSVTRPFVAKVLAEVWETEIAEIERQTTGNFFRLFSKVSRPS